MNPLRSGADTVFNIDGRLGVYMCVSSDVKIINHLMDEGVLRMHNTCFVVRSSSQLVPLLYTHIMFKLSTHNALHSLQN